MIPVVSTPPCTLQPFSCRVNIHQVSASALCTHMYCMYYLKPGSWQSLLFSVGCLVILSELLQFLLSFNVNFTLWFFGVCYHVCGRYIVSSGHFHCCNLWSHLCLCVCTCPISMYFDLQDKKVIHSFNLAFITATRVTLEQVTSLNTSFLKSFGPNA